MYKQGGRYVESRSCLAKAKAKAKGVVDGCRCGMELNRVAPGEWYYRYIFVVVAVVVYSSGRLGLAWAWAWP